MIVHYRNPHTGFIRHAPDGFSVTTLFFGAFVPLFRGDWKFFFLMCLVNTLALFLVVTLPIAWVYWAAKYNQHYQEKLMANGYEQEGWD